MRYGVVVGLAFASVLVSGASASAQSKAAACDRACLEAWLDRYVDAVVSHQPAKLTLAPAVKFTENGQRLEVGDGAWRTITAKGGYALKLADVEAGQAVLMGTIREADLPTIFILRLRIVEQRIAEIETLMIRNQSAAESLDRIGTPRATWAETVPVGSRLPRGELVRIANMYFSGIERNDGKGEYPIHETCARLENGAVTAGDPALVLVDPERGLAFAFAFFDNASGDTRKGTLADGRSVTSGPSVPWTWQIAEVFKIERGKIGPVESVLHQVPYGMGSGWSSWEDAMSSRARW